MVGERRGGLGGMENLRNLRCAAICWASGSGEHIGNEGSFMKEAKYRQYLEEKKDYQESSIKTQISRARRVEEFHGDLDEHYAQDRMASVIEELKYSRGDQQSNRPNPSKIQIQGDIYSNLASYRGSVEYYRNFMDEIADTEPSESKGGDVADSG